MLNILIPMGARSSFFDVKEYPFPVPLIEVNGKSIIERALASFRKIKGRKRFIFVVSRADCDKYHIDSVLELLTDGNCEIVRLHGETSGAACSSLMAIKHINNSDQLLISNGDQILEDDLGSVVDGFRKKFDAGVVCFETVHPRWSYVRLDEKGLVIEAAEKRPLSNKAIAGLYYFRKGSDFVSAAMRSIKKDASVNGVYYIAPTLNELVLDGKRIGVYKIANECYHTLYSPQKVKEYESILSASGRIK